MSRDILGNYNEGSDGNLKAEYDAASTIMRSITAAESNDQFTCMLVGELFVAEQSVDPIVDSYEFLTPSRMLHCLDIGTMGTLDGLPPMVETPGSRRSVANITLEANARGANVSSTLFGGVDCVDTPSTVAAGNPNVTRVGDGIINGYDVAILLWSQFKKPPYDSLPPLSEYSSVETVEANIGLAETCCMANNLTGWSCINDTAYTKSEYIVATNPLDGQCSAVHTIDYHPGEQAWGRRAAEDDGRALQLIDETADFVALAAAAATGAVVANQIEVYRWLTVPSVGQWTKIALPATALAIELTLINLDTSTIGSVLSFKAPPLSDCDPTSENCEPDVTHRDKTVVHYHRREDLIEEAGFTVRDCALIFPSRDAAIGADGAVGMYQEPASGACPFDLYVWTPVGAAFDANAPCDGQVGIEMGSSMNDGFGGFVVPELKCPSEVPSPPPPPAASPPPAPAGSAPSSGMAAAPPPPELKLSVSFTAVLGTNEVFDETAKTLYIVRLSQSLGITADSIEVSCSGPGCHFARRARALQQGAITVLTTTVSVRGEAIITEAASIATTMNALRTDFNALAELYGVTVTSASQPGIALAATPAAGEDTSSNGAAAGSISSGTDASATGSSATAAISGIVSALGVSTEDESLILPIIVAGGVASLLLCVALAVRHHLVRKARATKVQPAVGAWHPAPSAQMQRGSQPAYFKPLPPPPRAGARAGQYLVA